jgi:hypothetical protein
MNNTDHFDSQTMACLYSSDEVAIVDLRVRLRLQSARSGKALTYALEAGGNVNTPRKHRAQQATVSQTKIRIIPFVHHVSTRG